MERVILDTNILIEILKNNKDTIKILKQFSLHYISEITKMELFYGAFNKQELKRLKKFVSLFELIPVNKSISNKASELIYTYAKSHNLTIPDGIIASTSIKLNIELFTYNIKDFHYIDEIKIFKV